MRLGLQTDWTSFLRQKLLRGLWRLCALIFAFALYTSGLSRNPSGFFIDESSIAYDAYLISRTGVAEFGQRWPLYFKFYNSGSYGQPTLIYLLAMIFRILPPSILLARGVSALCGFIAALLLGFLARKLSGQKLIGIIVALTALVTPWLFEIGRLVFEVALYPLVLATFLLVLHHAQQKNRWSVREIAGVAASLGLLTYTYTIGPVLATLLAFGLLFFATSKQRLVGVLLSWAAFAITLIPLSIFRHRHASEMTKRFYQVSYIKPGVPWATVISQFFKRYLEDLSLTSLLIQGDPHPRHHVPGSGGAIFFATFILAVVGLAIIIVHRRSDPWWRFIIFGLAASIVPGAMTVEPFHGLRLVAYPVFLLVLMVPALESLLAPGKWQVTNAQEPDLKNATKAHAPIGRYGFRRSYRLAILGLLIIAALSQTIYFQVIFRRDGPKRDFEFDAPYKTAYDVAVAQRSRPIYLQDGYWGPAYIDALWYATVERRPTSEFVHLMPAQKPPADAVVISSEPNCQRCEIIKRSGVYLVYRLR